MVDGMDSERLLVHIYIIQSFLRALDLMAEAKYPTESFEVAIDQLYETVLSSAAPRSASSSDIVCIYFIYF